MANESVHVHAAETRCAVEVSEHDGFFYCAVSFGGAAACASELLSLEEVEVAIVSRL